MTNKLPVKCPLCGIEMQVVTGRNLDGRYTSKYRCPQCGVSTPSGKTCGRKQDAEDSALVAAFHRAKPGERYGNDAENTQVHADAQSETSLIAELLDAIEAIKAERPHDIFSLDDDQTYGFNAGWAAACARIESMLKVKMHSNETEGSL